MLIRTLTRAAGRLHFEPGDQLDLDETEAIELIKAGCAVLIEAPVKKDVEIVEQQPEAKKKRK